MLWFFSCFIYPVSQRKKQDTAETLRGWDVIVKY